jgi:hypothetical protein
MPPVGEAEVEAPVAPRAVPPQVRADSLVVVVMVAAH